MLEGMAGFTLLHSWLQESQTTPEESQTPPEEFQTPSQNFKTPNSEFRISKDAGLELSPTRDQFQKSLSDSSATFHNLSQSPGRVYGASIEL